MQTKADIQYFGRDLEAMSFAENYHQWILDEFEQYIGEHLLEVGAGTGNFTRYLLKRKPSSLMAIEPSDNMYPLLEQRLGDEQSVYTYKGYFTQTCRTLDTTPDTVFYINVLEHIEYDADELLHVHDTLASGGHVCIFVPALQWLYGNADKAVGHYRRYHKQPLENLLRSANFEVVKIKYFDIAGIIPWWLIFKVFGKDTVPGGQVSIYDRVIVPVMRRIESHLSPPIGKNLLIVGRKL